MRRHRLVRCFAGLLLGACALAPQIVAQSAAPSAPTAPAEEKEYDLLLKGGHVIDAKNKVDAIRDVAIKDGKIAKVAAGIPASSAIKTVNVTGLFSLTRSLMPMLLRSASPGAPSRVVNIGSMVGILPLADNAYSYATSKAAVHHLTRILANEFAGRGVNVNAIAPGPFSTRMTAYALGNDDGRDQAASTVPVGRIGEADDMAATILYLCGAGGSFVTGAVLPLDGGMSVQTRQHMFREDDQ